MKILKPANNIKCPICGCELEITSKDVWIELSDNVSIWTDEPKPGRRFVTCPICHSKIYLG